MSMVWFHDSQDKRFGVRIDDLRMVRPIKDGGVLFRFIDGEEIELPTAYFYVVEHTIKNAEHTEGYARMPIEDLEGAVKWIKERTNIDTKT